MLYLGMVCLQVCQNWYIYTLDLGRSTDDYNNCPNSVPRSPFFIYFLSSKEHNSLSQLLYSKTIKTIIHVKIVKTKDDKLNLLSTS